MRAAKSPLCVAARGLADNKARPRGDKS